MGSFTPTSVVARNVAVARIAERARRPDETDREARNRVSHLISYAVNRGKLEESSTGYFVFGHLAGWVRDNWPGLFDDWPRIVYAEFKSTVILRSSAEATLLPGSLERCHDMILRMDKEIAGLNKSLQSAQLEIERLKPDAEKWCELKGRNKTNASKPRK